METVYLLTETFYGNRVGGMTTNRDWVALNLERVGRSLTQLSELAKGHRFPILVFPAGGYVAVVQGRDDFRQAQMCFIHYEIDTEEYYAYFTPTFPPKTLKAIFDTQQLIASQGADYQESVVLTDEP